DKVVDAAQLAIYLLPAGKSDCDGYRRHVNRGGIHTASAAAASINRGHEPGLLQCTWIRDSGPDCSQIACDGMAARAFRFEERFSCFRISDNDARGALSAGVSAGYPVAVDESRDIGNFSIRKREFRHATIRAAV